MKGGGTLKDACALWKNPSRGQEPENVGAEDVDDTSYKTVYETLASIPNDDFLILKLGSNDNSFVEGLSGSGSIELNGKAYLRGSKGKKGTLFFERESKGEAGTAASSLIVNLSEPLIKQIINYSKSVDELLDAIDNKPEKKHLIAISPEKKYIGFSYPFDSGLESEDDNIQFFIQKKIGADIPDENRTYIQAVFPIGINNDSESYNYKILDLLINRPGPLLIFNAMGSTCYRSIKYILDKRTYLKDTSKLTLYGALVDVLEGSSCSFGLEIYPDPEERCKEVKGGKRSHTRRRKYRTRKHKKRTYKK